MVSTVRIGLLWRQEWDPPGGANGPDALTCKLRGMFAAFRELGLSAQPVVYSDDTAGAVRERLLELDGVLVWVNPIEQGLNRSYLDAVLRDVADAGVVVSAHPDVIERMGTKEVLVDTRDMSWGTDTRLYRTFEELQRSLPGRLGAGDRLVLKQRHGKGGHGVWKVESIDGDDVLAQHAADGAAPEQVALAEFLERCRPTFAEGGLMVEQPYQARIEEGMIRAYLTEDRVVGFTHQHPRGLLAPGIAAPLSAKVFMPPSEPGYQDLRGRLEAGWVAELQRTLGVTTNELPLIWDADFLLGPETAQGEDTYELCEINVSSTFTFPEFAMPGVARATVERIGSSSRL
jgi:hypothetical protein